MLFIENVINIIFVVLHNLHKQLCQSINRASIWCIWIQTCIFAHDLLMIYCHSMYDHFQIIAMLHFACKLIWQNKILIITESLEMKKKKLKSSSHLHLRCHRFKKRNDLKSFLDLDSIHFCLWIIVRRIGFFHLLSHHLGWPWKLPYHSGCKHRIK